MGCCGNHSGHSHSGQNTQKNIRENYNSNSTEKKSSWGAWAIVVILALLLIFSLLR